MVKIQRTAWRMSQEGESNEAIARELSEQTGRELTAHVIAVNIGRFEGRRENHPEKFFDSLLEDCDIKDGEELALILGVDIEDADEIVESKELTDEQIISLINYYDENIGVAIPDNGTPISIPTEQLVEPEAPDWEKQRQLVIDVVTKEVLAKLWVHTPAITDEVLQVVALPLGALGDAADMLTMTDLEGKFESAKHQIREAVFSEVKHKFGEEINERFSQSS